MKDLHEKVTKKKKIRVLSSVKSSQVFSSSFVSRNSQMSTEKNLDDNNFIIFFSKIKTLKPVKHNFVEI